MVYFPPTSVYICNKIIYNEISVWEDGGPHYQGYHIWYWYDGDGVFIFWEGEEEVCTQACGDGFVDMCGCDGGG